MSSSLSLSVRATGVSLPCGRYLIAPFTGDKEGSKCLTVLRVKPTPTRFPANSLYTPMDNTPLHSISSVCHPWGKRCVLRWCKPSWQHYELTVPLLSQLIERVNYDHLVVRLLWLGSDNTYRDFALTAYCGWKQGSQMIDTN